MFGQEHLKDARIQVLQRKHEGVSSARNAGLDAARGEFVSVVDALLAESEPISEFN